MDSKATSEFEQAAPESVGIVREFWEFLRFNKKWWLLPMLLIVLLLGLLTLLSGSAATPFIYSLF